MKTSVETRKIKQSWDIQKMQEAATRMVSNKVASRILFLEKHHSKDVDEMEKAAAQFYADGLTKCGVKTPMDLVEHLAEYEVNMFGSEASISGDDDCAVLISEKSIVWIETKQANKSFSKDQITAMQEHYTSWMRHLGHHLGFKAHVDIAKDGNSSKVTFTSK